MNTRNNRREKHILPGILGLVIFFYLLQMGIYPDFFFNSENYFYATDLLKSLNIHYFMAENLSRFHLPLADTYRNLGEPLGLFHVWLGIYSFQNLIYALLVRTLGWSTGYSVPFKHGYLTFIVIFNQFIFLSGYYLLLRKITKNNFAIFISLIYLCFFGFYGLYAYEIKILNISVLTPFLFLGVIDFFSQRADRRNFFLLVAPAALLFFYGPLESANYFYAAFFLLIGILISCYLKIFEGKQVWRFFRDAKNYPAVLLTLLLAAIIIFPIFYIVRNEVIKFSLPRSGVALSRMRFQITNFRYFNLAIPIFYYNYIGISWLILVIIGAVWGKAKLKASLLVYLLLTLIIPIFHGASNLLANIGYLLVLNSRLQRSFEHFTDFFPVLYLFFVALAVDLLLGDRADTVRTMLQNTFRKIQGWFWLLILLAAGILAYLSSRADLPESVNWYAWLYFYFLLLIAFSLLGKYSRQRNVKLVKLSLGLVVFLELVFLASSRNLFHEHWIKEIPEIKQLRTPSNAAFDNQLYLPEFNDTWEKRSLTTPLLKGRHYLPVEGDIYYNVKTELAARLLQSVYYNDYFAVFNRKFNILDLEALRKNVNFRNVYGTASGLMPVLIDIALRHQVKLDLNGHFQMKEHLADSFDFRSNFAGDTLLVFNQIYDPSWRLEIDGREEPIRNLDGYLMHFEVPAGPREVKLWYSNPLLKGSILLNYLITLIVLVYIFYYYFFSGKYELGPTSTFP